MEGAAGVLVVGDVLYDMVSKVDGPVAAGVDTFVEIHASPGGSAANVARWLARLDVRTSFVGRVGSDPFGDFLEAELRQSGVEAHLARDERPPSGKPTGKVFVLVDGTGERTMITDRGASARLSAPDLPESLFRTGGLLHLTGYMFSGDARRAAAFESLRLAGERGMTVSVDPSSVPLLEDLGVGRFLDWTSGVDLCLPNLAEGRLLSGELEPERIVSRLVESYPEVVLKLGSGGALYGSATGERVKVAVSGPSGPSGSSETLDALDTTGAGDALCAGFLAGRLSGSGTEAALARGVALAGEVVSGFGGSGGR